jgi:hypothetical protein
MENQSNEQPSSGSGVVISGYLFAIASIFLFPIPFGITGLVLGIINIGKGSTVHGIMIIILSCFCGLIGAVWGALSMSHSLHL